VPVAQSCLGGRHLAVTPGNGLSSPIRHYCEIDL
jgi:hypothetical protein